MDRQWRPSTTARGLSAVHIRPMIPPYTPPQFSLPGIRDPRRDYPFQSLSVQYGTTPSNSNTSIQRPLAHHRVMLSRRVIAYYGLIRDSESLPATYEFAAESAAPKEIGLRWESRGSPILLRWTVLACCLPYPGVPKSASDCCFLFGFSLHLPVTGSAITSRVSRLQSSFRAYFALRGCGSIWFNAQFTQPGCQSFSALVFGFGALAFGLGALAFGLGALAFGLGAVAFGLGLLAFGLGLLH